MKSKMKKDEYMKEIANKLLGHTRVMADCELKQLLHEASHCVDTRNTWVGTNERLNGTRVYNARGASRVLTLKEKLAWWIFKAVPVDAVAPNRHK